MFSKNTRAATDIWACFTFGYTIVLPGLLFWVHRDGWAHIAGNVQKKSSVSSSQHTYCTEKEAKAPKSNLDPVLKAGLRPRNSYPPELFSCIFQKLLWCCLELFQDLGKVKLLQTPILWFRSTCVHFSFRILFLHSYNHNEGNSKKSWSGTSVFRLLKTCVTRVLFPSLHCFPQTLGMVSGKEPVYFLHENLMTSL